MWPKFWQFQATLWQLPTNTAGLHACEGIAEQHWEYCSCYREVVTNQEILPAGLGYRWTRLYAWGVIPTICLNVLMKALTLL